MNWFTHLKVGSKLFFGFLVVALIGALIGVLGILKASQLSDLASLMYEREMVGSQHIVAANLDMVEATRSLRSALLSDTAQNRSRHLQDMQQRLDQSKVGLNAAEQTFATPEGKAQLAETYSALLAYDALAKDMAARLQAEPLPETGEATRYMFAVGAPTANKLSASMSQLVERKNANASELS